ncbi:hypothetical protein Tco_0169495 [Tanacetum coccineum]
MYQISLFYEEMDDSLERAATTATSLDAEQDRGAKKPWGIQLLRLGLRMYLNKSIDPLHEREEWKSTDEVKVIVKMDASKQTGELQAEEEEEERLAREKAQQVEEANRSWDDVQAKIDADYQLAQRLQAQEQEELTNQEKARLFLVEESSKKAKAEIAYERSLKRAGEELEQESSKKQKLEEDKESEELKQCLEIITDDGV